MNILKSGLAKIWKKDQETNLSMDSQDTSRTKLTSGWFVQEESETPRDSKTKKYGVYVALLISVITGFLCLVQLPFLLISSKTFCFYSTIAFLSGISAVWMFKGRKFIQETFLEGKTKYYSLMFFFSNILGFLGAFYANSHILCFPLALVQLASLGLLMLARVKEHKDGLLTSLKGVFAWRRATN